MRGVALDGSDRRELALPGDGTARLLPMPSYEPAIYVWYASFAMPPVTLRFVDSRREVVRTVYSQITASAIDSEQVVYTSKDGIYLQSSRLYIGAVDSSIRRGGA